MGEVEGWNTDSASGGYLSNHSVAEEYRGAGRAGCCDFLKTFAKTNSASKYLGRNERAIQRFPKNLPKCENKFKSF